MKNDKSCLQCNQDFMNLNKMAKYCSLNCCLLYRTSWDYRVNKLKKLFFNKVIIIPESCWDWSGSFLNGRGKLTFKGKAIQAHRASWIIHFGDIPKGLYVCHTCDNEVCCNPRHLFLGTPSENSRDSLKKDRFSTSKLTVAQVKEIKGLLKTGIIQNRIAEKFNVDPMTISDIKLNKTWSYIV